MNVSFSADMTLIWIDSVWNMFLNIFSLVALQLVIYQNHFRLELQICW